MQEKIIVAVSGGFDPVHIGHIRMFEEARKLGDELVVILNNDRWLTKKKGYVFMSEHERKEVLESIKWIDRVIISTHEENPADMSVSMDLQNLRPNIFANGGDRYPENMPSVEARTCDTIGCQIVFNIGHGGKVQSSSWLINKHRNQKNKN